MCFATDNKDNAGIAQHENLPGRMRICNVKSLHKIYRVCLHNVKIQYLYRIYTEYATQCPSPCECMAWMRLPPSAASRRKYTCWSSLKVLPAHEWLRQVVPLHQVNKFKQCQHMSTVKVCLNVKNDAKILNKSMTTTWNGLLAWSSAWLHRCLSCGLCRRITKSLSVMDMISPWLQLPS